MPFQYQPFVNPYVSSMSDLMGRGVEARSRAELTAAEAQAGAQRRLGDITGAQWSGLGQTIGQGIDAYVTEQREAPIREHAEWQRKQDKIAAERADVRARREDVEWGVGVQEREDKATFGTLLSETQPSHIDADGNIDMEALAQDMTRQWGETGRDPAILNEFNKTVQGDMEHDARMKQITAQIEAAGADTARANALIEQGKKENESYKAWQAIEDRTSPEALAAEDAYRLLRGATTRGETHAQRMSREIAVAGVRADGGGSGLGMDRERNRVLEDYERALASRDPHTIWRVEQQMYPLQLNPMGAREIIGREVENTDSLVHNRIYGSPGMMADPQRQPYVPGAFLRGLPEVSRWGVQYEAAGELPGAEGRSLPEPFAADLPSEESPSISHSQLRALVSRIQASQRAKGKAPDYTIEDAIYQALNAGKSLLTDEGEPSPWTERFLERGKPPAAATEGMIYPSHGPRGRFGGSSLPPGR